MIFSFFFAEVKRVQEYAGMVIFQATKQTIPVSKLCIGVCVCVSLFNNHPPLPPQWT